MECGLSYIGTGFQSGFLKNLMHQIYIVQNFILATVSLT